jgi:hypothetical protein
MMMRRGGELEGSLAEKWLLDAEEMLEEVKQAQWRSYERLRERKIAESLRAGLERVTLSLPQGGEEEIDLRLH